MQYGEFVEDAPRGHETEAFLLSILLSQQKKIEELKRVVCKPEKRLSESIDGSAGRSARSTSHRARRFTLEERNRTNT